MPGFIRDYEDPWHRRESIRSAKKLMDAGYASESGVESRIAQALP